MSSESLKINGVMAAVRAILFILCWWFIKRQKVMSGSNCTTYDVLERSGKRIALQIQSNISWFMGLIYAALFYYSLPILIWRYGKYYTLLFIATPFLVSFAITIMVTSNSSDNFLLGFIFKLVFCPIVGTYIASNDAKIYRKTLFARGWEMLGQCEATSRKKAIDSYK